MKISLVVPVFNEEDTIPIFYKTVREFNELKEYEIEIVLLMMVVKMRLNQ
ncbi:hypothetical protein SP22_56 [Salmonella phage 22]|uniref:Glycosyltransferase n=2 Tax=Salmonella phage P22 TaxID=10754 RepID=A0A0N7CE37_BPP22|nr:putative transcriptional repressor [Salmonella phage 34]AKJ74362.1 hypothetical protein SP22_56 [Salmonella phage 22]